MTDLDPNGFVALVQAAEDRNVPLIDAKAVVRAYLAALPPSPAIVPEGCKIVPVEPTEAMTKAGFGPFLAAHDPFFNKNEPTAPIYRAMLAASPSPPALDGAGRDAVIEECAKVVDAEMAHVKALLDLPWAKGDRDDHRTYGELIMCLGLCGKLAAAIRSIKETP